MKCHECGYANTEGAWLCINCGAKLKRDEDETQDPSAEHAKEQSDEFAPTISENLRRLRERASDGNASAPRRPQPTTGMPKIELPNLASGSTILGLPTSVWAVFAVVFVIALMVLSNLQ